MEATASPSWLGVLLGAVCLLVSLALVVGAIVGIVYLAKKRKSSEGDVPHPVVSSSSVTPSEESPNEPPTPGS